MADEPKSEVLAEAVAVAAAKVVRESAAIAPASSSAPPAEVVSYSSEVVEHTENVAAAKVVADAKLLATAKARVDVRDMEIAGDTAEFRSSLRAALIGHEVKDARMFAIIADNIAQNTAAALRLDKATADIIVAWESMKGGMKVLGWLGTFAKWLTAVAAAVAAVVAALYALTHWNG